MKNEFDKPIQGVSHRAVRSFDLFYVAIKYSQYAKGFSDASIIRIRPEYSLNTIRNFRERYQKEGIIVPLKQKKTFPNNEKFYKIKNMEKAKRLLDYFIEIEIKKEQEKKWGKYDHRFGREIPQELDIEYTTKPPKKFNASKKISKTNYIRKICPVCSKKMREFFNSMNYGPLDRKCLNCKFKFNYMDRKLIAIKD